MYLVEIKIGNGVMYQKNYKMEVIIMNKLWLVVHDTEEKKTWWKYFEKESDMDKFINKIKYIKNLFIVEDSRDIVYN